MFKALQLFKPLKLLKLFQLLKLLKALQPLEMLKSFIYYSIESSIQQNQHVFTRFIFDFIVN